MSGEVRGLGPTGSNKEVPISARARLHPVTYKDSELWRACWGCGLDRCLDGA